MALINRQTKNSLAFIIFGAVTGLLICGVFAPFVGGMYWRLVTCGATIGLLLSMPGVTAPGLASAAKHIAWHSITHGLDTKLKHLEHTLPSGKTSEADRQGLMWVAVVGGMTLMVLEMICLSPRPTELRVDDPAARIVEQQRVESIQQARFDNSDDLPAFHFPNREPDNFTSVWDRIPNSHLVLP
jgi:Na+/proline symporter